MGKDGSLYTKLNRISNRYNFDNITQKEILRGMQALLRANYILYEEKEAQGMIDIKIGSISQYTISEDKKTDFIKIISAMYDCRMFSFVDGKMASNKKQLIKELGKFLNTEIDDYSPLLSAAKRNANYLEIFDKLKGKGEDYFNK